MKYFSAYVKNCFCSVIIFIFANNAVALPKIGINQAASVQRLIVKLKSPNASSINSLEKNTLLTVSPEISIQQTERLLNAVASKHAVILQSIRHNSRGLHLAQFGQPQDMASALAIAAEIAQDPSVDYAEPDLMMVAQQNLIQPSESIPLQLPNDPMLTLQWHYFEPLGGINIEPAWALSKGENTVVAVLDTGIRNHADLRMNLLPGYDFISDTNISADGDGRDADPSDPGDAVKIGECGLGFPTTATTSNWHGTHLAGIVAAIANNGIGISGVAPKASVLPIRVLGKCGGYTSDIADAILWAAGIHVDGVPDNVHPATVINLSFGSGLPAVCGRTYDDAITAATQANVMVVVAAGNSLADANYFSPQNCPHVISVAATDRSGKLAWYSNFASSVSIAAPGGDMRTIAADGILSTANSGEMFPADDNYIYYQGTSMAAPQVAGVIALMHAANNNLPPDQISLMLKDSARPFSSSCNLCGAGILDAGKAVAMAKGIIAPAKVDMKIEVTGTPGVFEFLPGQLKLGVIRYQAKITNRGPKAVAFAKFNAEFAGFIRVIAMSPSQGRCDLASAQCDIGELKIGDSATVAITVESNTFSKTYFGSSVSSEFEDLNPADNTDQHLFGGAISYLSMLYLLALMGFRRTHQTPLNSVFAQCRYSSLSANKSAE